MGFHLRKSFKVGAFRFNLSNSGLGFSVGSKGLRVGVDGKGRAYIGGGKGILRFRQLMSNAKINEEIQKNDNSYNTMLQYTGLGCFTGFILILSLPLILFFYVAFTIALTSKYPLITLISWLVGLIYLIKFMYKFSIPNFWKNFKEGLNALKNEDLENALNNFKNSKQLEEKAKVLKFKINGKFILNLYIYLCLDNLKKYEECLNFILHEVYLDGRREKIVKCYYNLEKWDELINYLQTSYDAKEKEEHPIYYAMLGNAFLKQEKIQIALETMLSGPIQKRTMNSEMCAFRYTLGECYEANGDKENALKQYNKVYAFDVNYEDIQEKIKSNE